MDGIQATRAVREGLLLDIPILAVSGACLREYPYLGPYLSSSRPLTVRACLRVYPVAPRFVAIFVPQSPAPPAPSGPVHLVCALTVSRRPAVCCVVAWRVVACAAEVGSDVREQILSAGANLLIAKPANGEVRLYLLYLAPI